MPTPPPMFRFATHDPRRHLVDWLAAMRCAWYPVELDVALNPSQDPGSLLAAQCKVGTETVLLQLEKLYAEYREERYRPSALLHRMVREGSRFPLSGESGR